MNFLKKIILVLLFLFPISNSFGTTITHNQTVEYETGSLVVLGQDGELEISTRRNDRKVFGVTQKGACQPIILGAEPVLVTGNIKAGDFIKFASHDKVYMVVSDFFSGAWAVRHSPRPFRPGR